MGIICASLPLVLFCIGCAILNNAHKNAPFGWEDENGFHLGEKKS